MRQGINKDDALTSAAIDELDELRSLMLSKPLEVTEFVDPDEDGHGDYEIQRRLQYIHRPEGASDLQRMQTLLKELRDSIRQGGDSD